jgi:RNA polymerase sigma-70 factor (ECF subfamily)
MAMTRTPQDILDEWLVLRCQGWDTEALRELVARYEQRIWRHALHLTGRRDAARDVAQETWLAIVRGLPRLRDPASFRTWAYRIVARRSADWIRRQQRDRARQRQPAPQFETPTGSDRNLVDDDELAALREAIRTLPAHHRSVLDLHYRDGLSVAEIAVVLGIPPGTVKSRLHHARQTLRHTLERKTQ